MPRHDLIPSLLPSYDSALVQVPANYIISSYSFARMGAHLTYDEFNRSIEYIIKSHDPLEWFPDTNATWKWVCGGDQESVLVRKLHFSIYSNH